MNLTRFLTGITQIKGRPPVAQPLIPNRSFFPLRPTLSVIALFLPLIVPSLANPLIRSYPATDTPVQPPSQLQDLPRFVFALFDFSFSFYF